MIRSIKMILEEDYFPDATDEEDAADETDEEGAGEIDNGAAANQNAAADQNAPIVRVWQHLSDSELHNIKEHGNFKLLQKEWKKAGRDYVRYILAVRNLPRDQFEEKYCKQRDYLQVLYNTDQHFESHVHTQFNRYVNDYENGKYTLSEDEDS